MKSFIYYLIIISVFSVIMCCSDKLAAKNGKRRISEKNLMFVSVLGGSVAMYVTMRIIRHKTRHNKFMIGLPLIILTQIAVGAILFYFKKM